MSYLFDGQVSNLGELEAGRKGGKKEEEGSLQERVLGKSWKQRKGKEKKGESKVG